MLWNLMQMKDSYNKFLDGISPKTYKAVRLSFYIVIIFAAHMSSAVLTEKIYKTPYQKTSFDPSDKQTDNKVYDYFSNPFGIPLFSGFFGLCYGFFMYQILHHNSQYMQSQISLQNPQKSFMKLALVNILVDICISLAIILTSFTTINLVNCCKLLAVVLFAVFFSKTEGKYKIGKRQIVVASIISLGIVMFNVFAGDVKQTGADHPLNIWTTLLMLGILIVQGYQPQLTLQIRQKYSPPPSFMYYQVSKYSFLIILIASLFSTYLYKLLIFIWEHDQLAMDLMLHSILDVIGTTFIYRIMVLHRQHIVPMVVTLRKLFTGIFNLYYFKHQVSNLQYVGLGVVFAGIMLELWLNYKANQEKFTQIQDTCEQPQPYLSV